MTPRLPLLAVLTAAAAVLAGSFTVTLAAAPAADPAPRWFKGNLHTHSLWSDGNDYPEMIADSYKRAGYHFLAMSDHNVLAEGARWLELKAPAAVKGEVV
ncbi:MAG: PHP domain-containing protein, partial [Opitutaceae bacterium]